LIDWNNRSWSMWKAERLVRACSAMLDTIQVKREPRTRGLPCFMVCTNLAGCLCGMYMEQVQETYVFPMCRYTCIWSRYIHI
jgi:hypothetical protein